jgi:hypothetical protein
MIKPPIEIDPKRPYGISDNHPILFDTFSALSYIQDRLKKPCHIGTQVRPPENG